MHMCVPTIYEEKEGGTRGVQTRWCLKIVQVHWRTCVPIHRYTDVPVYFCAGEPVSQSTPLLVYYQADVLVHNRMHRGTGVPLYQCIGIPV